ncbi:MAG: lipoyl(octanoyl) transferase LipB [Verrucomicrobia bacterium]|nr:lipoyl(octanoyl) transferase LipB [Verrucomicrobiota bacterium]
MELELEWLGHGVDYAAGLRAQELRVEERIGNPETAPERLLLLEHAPVFTIGRTPDRSSIFDEARLRAPLFTIGRGGQATYHGPGQLVGYPILDLGRRGRDLHLHLRTIEELLIVALAECGVTAQRREGLTGVWVEDRKIASIGVGVRRWISFHGFALNVTQAALPPFADITPCGLGGVVMTALEVESGRAWSVREFAEVVGQVFRRELDRWMPPKSMAAAKTGEA